MLRTVSASEQESKLSLWPAGVMHAQIFQVTASNKPYERRLQEATNPMSKLAEYVGFLCFCEQN